MLGALLKQRCMQIFHSKRIARAAFPCKSNVSEKFMFIRVVFFHCSCMLDSLVARFSLPGNPTAPSPPFALYLYPWHTLLSRWGFFPQRKLGSRNAPESALIFFDVGGNPTRLFLQNQVFHRLPWVLYAHTPVAHSTSCFSTYLKN